MSESKRVLSLADLAGLGVADIGEVELPNASKALGEPVVLKVRALETTELLSCADFPLGDVMEAAENGGPESDDQYATMYREHVKAFDAEDMLRMMYAVVKMGTVDPKLTDEGVRALKSDVPIAFRAIMEKTVPSEAAEKAGLFRSDG